MYLRDLEKESVRLRENFCHKPQKHHRRRARKTTLTDLISKFGEHDAVIWDNFPDDLRKRDLTNSILALELISSRQTKQLLVSLKPKYWKFLQH